MLAYSNFLTEKRPDYIDKVADDNLHHITPEEAIAVKSYVSTSTEINGYIRDPAKWETRYRKAVADHRSYWGTTDGAPSYPRSTKDMASKTELLKSAIAKHIVPRPVVVYRGTSDSELLQLFSKEFVQNLNIQYPARPEQTRYAIPAGLVYKTNQFMSTSTSPRVAWNLFASLVMFAIKVPSGKRAMPVHYTLAGYNDSEDELLFAPGAVFRVDAVETRKRGRSARIIMTCISDGLH